MRQLRCLRTRGWPRLRAKPPPPHCGYPEGRDAFLGLETEGEEASPVSESHQLLIWFPRAQARVLWGLPASVCRLDWFGGQT